VFVDEVICPIGQVGMASPLRASIASLLAWRRATSARCISWSAGILVRGWGQQYGSQGGTNSIKCAGMTRESGERHFVQDHLKYLQIQEKLQYGHS
jgi:hypothetical protein